MSSLQCTSIPSVRQLNAFLKSFFSSSINPLIQCVLAVRIKTNIGELSLNFLNIVQFFVSLRECNHCFVFFGKQRIAFLNSFSFPGRFI